MLLFGHVKFASYVGCDKGRGELCTVCQLVYYVLI